MRRKDRCISNIFDVNVDCILVDRVLKRIEIWLDSRGKRVIVTANPEMIVLSQKDLVFKKIVNQADLVVPDGVGLVWAMQHLDRDKKSKIVVKRIAGVDLMINLGQLAQKKKKRVFLLGGKGSLAIKAAQVLKTRFSGLQIAAFSGPKKVIDSDIKEKEQTLKKINDFKTDLLLVAFGHGKQERWIADNLSQLKIKVAMGVGGAFDYLVSPWRRAPKMIQRLGLEWWWRLMLQPWRIKRQMAIIKFIWMVYSF